MQHFPGTISQSVLFIVIIAVFKLVHYYLIILYIEITGEYRYADGFHVYRNECLYIGSTYVTWNEAQGFWDSLNSSMLTIQDATKYNIVKSE